MTQQYHAIPRVVSLWQRMLAIRTTQPGAKSCHKLYGQLNSKQKCPKTQGLRLKVKLEELNTHIKFILLFMFIPFCPWNEPVSWRSAIWTSKCNSTIIFQIKFKMLHLEAENFVLKIIFNDIYLVGQTVLNGVFQWIFRFQKYLINISRLWHFTMIWTLSKLTPLLRFWF